MTEESGIYCIQHRASGKIYVGSAGCFSHRWNRHRTELRLGTHKNPYLQAAWTKHGEDAFDFSILDFTKDLTIQEQFWMDHFKSANRRFGYNLCAVARSSRGRKWTKEERAKRLVNKKPRLPLTVAQLAARVKSWRANCARNTKLTWEQACEIRLLYGKPTRYGLGRREGSPTLVKLGKQFGVRMGAVYDVVHFNTWRTAP